MRHEAIRRTAYDAAKEEGSPPAPFSRRYGLIGLILLDRSPQHPRFLYRPFPKPKRLVARVAQPTKPPSARNFPSGGRRRNGLSAGAFSSALDTASQLREQGIATARCNIDELTQLTREMTPRVAGLEPEQGRRQ